MRKYAVALDSAVPVVPAGVAAGTGALVPTEAEPPVPPCSEQLPPDWSSLEVT
ncbi:MAG: hypothetical protein LAQ69_39380 [Acidobacteriia bacterium]|nr:hypothetical protein [Terriglobia bacterium]